MPALATPREILDALRKYKVVDEKRLDSYLQRINIDRVSQDASQWVNALVQEGVLTNYQALQILQGKWKNFSIGKFRILERLGFGAMSNVYLCENTVTQARVAVKALTKIKAGDAAAEQRFFREARAAALLDHPNIVRAYGIDEYEKGYFMVMDFVDGSSLADIVQQFGPLDPTRAAHYARQGALGLQYAHEKGLVHRDIKPGNLLVDRQGTVKILDMGLARFILEEGQNLTQGEILGSPEFLAPEQAEDSHNVDIRADIYSLGATLYFMLSGKAPFSEEKTLAHKIISKQTRDPIPLLELAPGLPADLVALVEKMMARQADGRFPTPADVVEALAPWTATPIPPPPEQEMPRLSAAAQANGTGPPPAAAAKAVTPTPQPVPTLPTATPAPDTVQVKQTLRINPQPSLARKEISAERPEMGSSEPTPRPKAVETAVFDVETLTRQAELAEALRMPVPRAMMTEPDPPASKGGDWLQALLFVALFLLATGLALLGYFYSMRGQN